MVSNEKELKEEEGIGGKLCHLMEKMEGSYKDSWWLREHAHRNNEGCASQWKVYEWCQDFILLGSVGIGGLSNNDRINAKGMHGPLDNFTGIIHTKDFGGNGMLFNDLNDELAKYGKYFGTLYEEVYPIDLRITIDNNNVIKMAGW